MTSMTNNLTDMSLDDNVNNVYLKIRITTFQFKNTGRLGNKASAWLCWTLNPIIPHYVYWMTSCSLC